MSALIAAGMRENRRSGGTIELAMADQDAPDHDALLAPRELARQRGRDRKRTTRMVVDNAGVKRILQAQRDRAARRASQNNTVAAGEATGTQRAGGR